ncbi:FtsH protease activity modulator HflK [Permianibacter aggregans]|uniref:Protein HflK n=1 Tax=Permianibacter aggregans TaxID=1510150 RepID=A0A4R6UV76_9GAMM|nr:FtsH protease activity modulator HflK [Permianibacter aggregans]QGX40528.1 FtsH protease activity modulator HflK [Permianibacter aggregans]TDQ49325.1 protease FtsH subunit HflK [Permianibacter aggregans]
MPWNEPGNGNNQDPWGQRRKPQGGPPDLDDFLKDLGKKLGGIFGGGKGPSSSGGGGSSGKANSVLGFVILAVVVFGYGLAGIYQVDEKERAIVLRFGEYNRIEGSGLNWAPPIIDQVNIVNTTSVQQEIVRGRMLTKDEFLVDVSTSVQYRIADPQAYLFNVVDPDFTLQQATEAALRSVIGQSQLDDILTAGKSVIQSQTRELLREILEPYKTGLEIADVNFQEADPPQEVRAAFDDAIKAREDKGRMVQEAQAYREKELPLAQANAQRILQEAEAYKAQVTAQARGEVQRFEKLLPQYLAAPEVTRNRLYIETMEEVLSKVSKVVVDDKGGNNMLYLPLDKMGQQRSNAGAAGAAMEGR